MATVKKPATTVQRSRKAKEAPPKEVPIKEEPQSAPEPVDGAVAKRKRLAKAFKRPLDKTLRASPQVREKYTMPEGEFEQLLVMKQRLSDLGVPVKKSELVRAGLLQLAGLDDAELKDALFKIQLVG